uniref:Uncharacterized protein n=1 Tax=Acrobeloides nanus TaxID=290746 RepID=A0A914CY12_9BILA
MKPFENDAGSWKLRKWKCCSPLTKLETCLLCISLLLLFFLLGICSFWFIILEGYRVFTVGIPAWRSRNPLFFHERNDSVAFDASAVHNDRLVCTSRECANIAAFFAANLNEKVNPCNDFYDYACGNYELTRELQANKPLRHTIIDAQTLLHKQIKTVLEEPISERDKPWDKLAKDYYTKCLDETALQSNGRAATLSLLDSIGGWPVLMNESDWKEFGYNWETYTAEVLNKTGITAILFEISVSHDPNNSSVTVIELDQPKFGIGARWPYMNGINDSMVQNYTELMTQIAIRLGATEEQARNDMIEATEFEIKLVGFSADETSRRDPERSNNPFQLWQLKQHFPFIDFEAYIKRTFHGIVNISENDTIVIREKDYFKGVQHILRSTSKRVLANYVGWRVVQGFSPFLPAKDREPFYEFKANQTGMFNVPSPERWEDCVSLSILLLDMPVGKLFVENFFDEHFALPKMKELTYYLKNAFIRELRQLDWMDSVTKERAIAKANAIEYKSGYPAQLFNDTWMKLNWGIAASSQKESLLNLTVRIKLERTKEELNRFKRPVDRSFWFQSPAQVDAFYAPNLNEMIFPAGIMQFPFLSTGVPNYIVYAMVGAVVGHEVSHAFDDQGGRYDELGNLNDWWDVETAEKFFDKAECFVQQYQEENIKEAGDQKLNGRLSLGENIADNGGVKTALAAYKSWKRESGLNEPALPGFQNFSSEQMFFIAYANNWCSMMRPKYIVQLINTDVHAPGRFRAVIPLRNRHDFAEAFKCPVGSPMNPIKKCSIW